MHARPSPACGQQAKACLHPARPLLCRCAPGVVTVVVAAVAMAVAVAAAVVPVVVVVVVVAIVVMMVSHDSTREARCQ